MENFVKRFRTMLGYDWLTYVIGLLLLVASLIRALAVDFQAGQSLSVWVPYGIAGLLIAVGVGSLEKRGRKQRGTLAMLLIIILLGAALLAFGMNDESVGLTFIGLAIMAMGVVLVVYFNHHVVLWKRVVPILMTAVIGIGFSTLYGMIFFRISAISMLLFWWQIVVTALGLLLIHGGIEAIRANRQRGVISALLSQNSLILPVSLVVAGGLLLAMAAYLVSFLTVK